MVALSRLKATFEACLGLFRQNMKTLARESRRGGMQKPRGRVRRTEPLPTMYSLQYTRRPKQLRTAENAWARAASVSVPYACRQSGPEASEKASLFGKWRWLGHAEEYGHMWCMCVMPFTGFSTSSTLTLWILSKHSKPQPVWCALPLLHYSTQHLHPFTCHNLQLRAFPFLNEDIIMDGLSRELPAYFARTEGVSFKADRMADLAAKKVESGGDRMRKICNIGPGQWIWFFLSSLVLRLLSEFSPRLTPAVPPFQVSSRLHSLLCGDQRDASLHSLLRQ